MVERNKDTNLDPSGQTEVLERVLWAGNKREMEVDSGLVAKIRSDTWTCDVWNEVI